MELWQIRHFQSNMQTFARLTGLRWTATGLLLLVGGGLALRSAPRLSGADAPPPAPAPQFTPGRSTSVGNAVPSEAAEAEPTGHSAQAAELLHAAKQRLFSLTSVQADLREFVVLGDRRFEAIGRYVAGPFNPLPQLRLEYQVRVGDTEGLLLEVCDGQILRSQRTIRRISKDEGESTTAPRGKEASQSSEVVVTRRDVRKILEAVQKHGPTPETILQAELGIGGLPALLTSLERAMVFDSVREEPLAGRRCYVLHGRWRPEFLAELQRQFALFRRDVDPHLPDSVRIHLDAEMLFPLRLTYWPAPASDVQELSPTLTLEFTNIRLNEPVPPELFEFVSNGADESDVTNDFIEAIRAAAPPAAPEADRP